MSIFSDLKQILKTEQEYEAKRVLKKKENHKNKFKQKLNKQHIKKK